MLGYSIDPSDVKLISKVNFLKTEFTGTVCNIYINATMTYGIDEYYLLGRIYKDYKIQGNYTYINGIDKEYKGVKPVLNAINKYAYNNDCLGIEVEKILIFTGLKKDIKETRTYKKLMKDQAKQAEEVKAESINNSDAEITPETNTNKNLQYVLSLHNSNMLAYEFNTLGIPTTEEEAILWMENFQKLRNKLVENNQVIFESQVEAKQAVIDAKNSNTKTQNQVITNQATTPATISTTQSIKNDIIEQIPDEALKTELYQALNNNIKIGYTNNLRGIPQATYEDYDNHLFIIINPNRLQAEYVSKYLYTLENKIKEVYCCTEDMELLKDLYYNNHDEFIQVIKEDAKNQITQYSYENIVLYFDNLFKLESIIPDITEQQKELKRIALNILNRGYSIELKEDVFNYLIYLQPNSNIEGYLWINKNKWIQDKKLKLINDNLKLLLMKYNDLFNGIYGITNNITGVIPINYNIDASITKPVITDIAI